MSKPVFSRLIVCNDLDYEGAVIRCDKKYLREKLAPSEDGEVLKADDIEKLTLIRGYNQESEDLTDNNLLLEMEDGKRVVYNRGEPRKRIKLRFKLVNTDQLKDMERFYRKIRGRLKTIWFKDIDERDLRCRWMGEMQMERVLDEFFSCGITLEEEL